MVIGTGASGGIGIGRVMLVREQKPVYERRRIRDTKAELKKLREAVESFVKATEELADKVMEEAGEKEAGILRGHIILLNSVKEREAYQKDLEQAFDALSAFPGGMQAGGGITPETAGCFLDAGASHVIVTSYVFRNGKLNEAALREMIGAAGSDRLV